MMKEQMIAEKIKSLMEQYEVDPSVARHLKRAIAGLMVVVDRKREKVRAEQMRDLKQDELALQRKKDKILSGIPEDATADALEMAEEE